MKRKENWQGVLKDYIRTQARREYKVGKFDGPMFTAAWVKVITGKDLARGFRGYTTLLGGMKKLKAKGYDGFPELLADQLIEVPPLTARAGDVVVVDTELGLCVGIAQGHFVLCVDPVAGVGAVPMSKAVRAFTV
jgi:hypothetical protein